MGRPVSTIFNASFVSSNKTCSKCFGTESQSYRTGMLAGTNSELVCGKKALLK